MADAVLGFWPKSSALALAARPHRRRRIRDMGMGTGYADFGAGIAPARPANELEANPAALAADFDAASGIAGRADSKTVMRRYGVANPYEKLKDLTRGKEGITPQSAHRVYQRAGDSRRSQSAIARTRPRFMSAEPRNGAAYLILHLILIAQQKGR